MKRSEICGREEASALKNIDAFLEADRPVQATGLLNDAARWGTTKLVCELLEEILDRLPAKEDT